LLWRKQDAGILGYFANQISDSAERDRAWQRYHKIRDFAESSNCRHLQICTHFGETPKWRSCGACDICGAVPEWMVISKSRAAVRKTFAASPASRPVVAVQPDSELRDYLREWRRNTAKEQGMPAYVVLHDTTLDEICRIRPSSMAELMSITGIGERKAELYGAEILAALQRYQEGARASAIPQKLTAPGLETLQLLKEEKTLEQIAETRGRQLATIINTVAALVESGQVEFQPAWIEPNRDAVITAACERAGLDNLKRLKPLKDLLPPEITYEEIRLVVARLRKERELKNPAPA
jgi:ATP-dependent DNA helicase RecQ